MTPVLCCFEKLDIIHLPGHTTIQYQYSRRVQLAEITCRAGALRNHESAKKGSVISTPQNCV